MAATLTFTGLAPEVAIGIDTLHGFEQELITQQAAEGLVIPGLLVKDHPIFVLIEAA